MRSLRGGFTRIKEKSEVNLIIKPRNSYLKEVGRDEVRLLRAILLVDDKQANYPGVLKYHKLM